MHYEKFRRNGAWSWHSTLGYSCWQLNLLIVFSAGKFINRECQKTSRNEKLVRRRIPKSGVRVNLKCRTFFFISKFCDFRARTTLTQNKGKNRWSKKHLYCSFFIFFAFIKLFFVHFLRKTTYKNNIEKLLQKLYMKIIWKLYWKTKLLLLEKTEGKILS